MILLIAIIFCITNAQIFKSYVDNQCFDDSAILLTLTNCDTYKNKIMALYSESLVIIGVISLLLICIHLFLMKLQQRTEGEVIID